MAYASETGRCNITWQHSKKMFDDEMLSCHTVSCKIAYLRGCRSNDILPPMFLDKFHHTAELISLFFKRVF